MSDGTIHYRRCHQLGCRGGNLRCLRHQELNCFEVVRQRLQSRGLMHSQGKILALGDIDIPWYGAGEALQDHDAVCETPPAHSAQVLLHPRAGLNELVMCAGNFPGFDISQSSVSAGDQQLPQ